MTFVIGTPHTHNSGYYKNDDRLSGGRLSEADVQSCTHCQAVIKMQEWRIEGAWCSKCSAPICVNCGARAVVYGCEPFLAQLEKYFDSTIKYQQHLKIAGLEPPPVPQSLITSGNRG